MPGCWIVDPDSRTVERWTPDDECPEVLDTVLTWQPPGADEPLILDLVALFRRVWRESE